MWNPMIVIDQCFDNILTVLTQLWAQIRGYRPKRTQRSSQNDILMFFSFGPENFLSIPLNRFDKMKIEISSISSETIFESLETISGPISWFECSIRVLGTQLARFHSYFQNPSRKFITSSRLCPLKYPLDHMVT